MRGYLLLATLVIALAVLWLRWPADPPHGPEALRSLATPASQDAIARAPVEEPPAENGSQRVALPVALEEEAGIVLEGRVIELAAGADPALGTPAVGATVSAGVESLGRLGSEGVRSSATTGADGSFRIVLADDGKRPLPLELFIAEDERFRGTHTTCRLEQGEGRRVGLLLARYRHGALVGRTIDVQGQAVPSVEIVLLTWDETGESLNAPVATTVSDEQGAFRFESAPEFKQIEVRKEGYTLLEAALPQQSEDGTWEPMEIVLSGEGTLRIHVIDPAGEPVSGVRVRVSVAQPERFASAMPWRSLRMDPRSETDSSGTARLSGVWADQRLRITLWWSGSGRLEDVVQQLAAFERVEDDELVLEGGEPLFLAPGTDREVRLETAGRFRIFGRVLNGDRSGFERPSVSVTSLDRPRNAAGGFHQLCRGDVEGRFELGILTVRPFGRVLVTATNDEPSIALVARAPSVAAWATLDLRGRASGEEELTLIAEPTLAIAGRVVSDPTGIRTIVRAHALTHALPFGLLPTGAQSAAYSNKAGEFRVGGLPPGRYDLEVSPSSQFPTVWVRDVAAGTEDLTIPLGGTRPARVTVEVVLSEGELDQAILLTGKLRPFGELPDAPELPANASYGALAGWPPSLIDLWYGGGGHTDEQGSTSFSLVPLQENPTTVELDEGLLWIGAKARAKDGNLAFPIGTGLVRVSAGEHRLRFELTPSASIEGRVIGGVPGRELFVALASEGRLLTLDVGRNEMRPMSELGLDGFFRFPLVPAGKLELRVGTREELLGDRWTHREDLLLERGAKLHVEVTL